MKADADGTFNWNGGMDASRFPEMISESQYSRACNMMLPDSGGGIETRFGIHCIKIDFKNSKENEEIFRNGRIQGEGWFVVNGIHYLLVSISGYIFKLQEITPSYYSAYIINKDDRNFANADKVWITRVPDGAIVNDGLSCPMFVKSFSYRRSRPSQGEITAGRMGVYVQNRFFYVSQDAKRIIGSDFLNPYSLSESINTNIEGFFAPENEDEITAIGRQKVIIDYIEGGALAFGTKDNTYSVDVRGDRQDWEEASSGAGKTIETVSGVGPTSSNSFEPFNTNIHYRTWEHGIANLKQSQYQYANNSDLSGQSIEVNYWLDNDTEWLLDRCYSRAYRSKLYTTIAPKMKHDGSVYWSGMVVLNPDPTYSNQETSPRRFEGIITGVRPCGITVVNTGKERQKMFFWSYDADGVNRLYKAVDDSIDDVNHNGEAVKIESWVETRGYSHKSLDYLKKPTRRYYSIRDLRSDVYVTCKSRTSASGEWLKYDERKHLVKMSNAGERNISKPQRRKNVNLTEEPDSNSEAYGEIGGNYYYVRQDRLEFKGHLVLDRFVRHANIEENTEDISPQETESLEDSYRYSPDFSYSICQSPTNAPIGYVQ